MTFSQGAQLVESPNSSLNRLGDALGLDQDFFLTYRYDQEQLAKIVELGLEVYTPQGLRLFIETALPRFNGNTARQQLQEGDYSSVLDALVADYEGMGF